MTSSPIADSITLTGLRVNAHHGVYDFERENGQDFVIDVTVWLDFAQAAGADDIAQTIHYGELAVEVAEAARHNPVDLIETVAERIAGVVLAHAVAQRVQVTVHKPSAPIEVPFTDVSVQITREQITREHATSGQITREQATREQATSA